MLGKRRYRPSEVLLHVSGSPTYRELTATGERRTCRVEGSDRRGRSGFSSGGFLSQYPFKCIVEIAEDADSVFAQDVTIYLKHAG